MPSESLSIYFTIKDGASVALASITDKTKSLDKENQQLRQSYTALQKANEGLIRRQTELKKELQTAREEAKDARKAFDDLGDSISQDAYDKAREKVENLKNEISATSKALRENEKIFKSNMETIRKNTSGDSDGFSMLAKGIVSGQAGQMLSASLGGAAEAALTSAIGTPVASLISDTVSSAITGAAAGAMFGLPGMLAGGAVGAVSGIISGGTQIFGAKDDAFGSYYQEAAETALSDQSTAISSGSTIAGGREQTRLAFARRFGSTAAADEFLDEVKAMASTTNYSYDEITGYAKSLLNSYGTDELFGVLQSLSDATAGLDLSSSDVSMMISGLSRMRTTGKATQEYLNYFSERGVDVYSALAGATGADRSQIAEMVSDGQIGGVEAAQAILDYINETFGGLSEDLARTYDAMVDNLADAEANLQERAGQGYNEERSRGIAEQQQWLEDNEGSLGSAYSMIGQWQASLENTKERLEREALDAVMHGVISESYADSDQRSRLEELAEEYKSAIMDYANGDQEAGATMGQLLAEAQVIAMNEYNASDGAQLALESELSLAESIREDTASNSAYWAAGYRKGEEYSKGLAAGILGGADAGATPDTSGAAFQHPMLKNSPSTEPRGYATGLDYVPRDNFPALLHQGERVLTAGEARALDRGSDGPISVNITGEWHVRSDSDVDAIADAIVEKLRLARMTG